MLLFFLISILMLYFTVNVTVPPFWDLIQSSDWLAGQTGSANLRNETQRESVEIQHFNDLRLCVSFCVSACLTQAMAHN